MDENTLTPQGIEAIVATYVTEGPVSDIIGRRGDYCQCPGARAVTGAIARSLPEGTPFQIIFGHHNLHIYNGSLSGHPIIVDHTPRVTAFIAALDNAGRKNAQIRRKAAKVIWQATEGVA